MIDCSHAGAGGSAAAPDGGVGVGSSGKSTSLLDWRRRPHGFVGRGTYSGGDLGHLSPSKFSDEALPGLFMIVGWVVEPRGFSDRLDCRSLASVILEKTEDELLEASAEIVSVDLGEVCIQAAGQKQSVEVLLLSRFFEGENSLHDNKDDYAEGEEIDLATLVVLAFLDLRRHVCHGASVGLQVVNVLVARKTEVCDLEVQTIVNEDILKFKITMHDTLLMHVFKGVEHLSEEETACVFSHSAHRLTEIEQKASRHELHHDVYKVVDMAA